MKGDNDHSAEKQDNKASPSGGKRRLPLYICAGVVALALAIGGYFVFADNPPEVPVIEENGPQDPNDPYNNGGVIATGNGTIDPTATATISPTSEITPTQQPPEPAPTEVILDPTSGEVTVFTTSGAESPYVSPNSTIVPTATATVVPTPSKAPVTPDNPPTPPPPTGTPKPVPTPTPTPKAPETQAPKTGPEYVDTARSNIAHKKGVVEVIECKWKDVYGGFTGEIRYTDGTVTVTVRYEYYLESDTLSFTYVNADGEEKGVGL